MPNKRHQLYLFSQLPLYAKFRYETPLEGKVYVKTSATSAFHDTHNDGQYHHDNYHKVSLSVLVFPVFDFDALPYTEEIDPEQGADAETTGWEECE